VHNLLLLRRRLLLLLLGGQDAHLAVLLAVAAN
jgi:hypothetical protein